MDNLQIPDQTASGTPCDANRDVLDVIRRAEQQLRLLLDERAEVIKRIGTVKRAMVGLAKLLGRGILDAALVDLRDCKSSSRQPGITLTCRRVLIQAGRPLSAREVCDEIQRTAPALLAHHQDPMMTINTILGRLVRYGQVTPLTGDRGHRAWLWTPDCDRTPGSALVAEESDAAAL